MMCWRAEINSNPERRVEQKVEKFGGVIKHFS